jgi:hypothetical protein
MLTLQINLASDSKKIGSCFDQPVQPKLNVFSDFASDQGFKRSTIGQTFVV